MQPTSLLSRVWSWIDELPLVTLSVFALCLLAFGNAAGQELLQYDRAAVAAGEWRRLVTGHLAHWDLSHLFWDGVVFVALGGWLERRNRRSYAALLVLSTLAVSIGVWHLLPGLEVYRGLSGIDTTLFTVVATTYLVDCLRAGDRRMALLAGGLMLGLAAKTLFEQATGGTLFVDATAAGFSPVPLAHLVGAAVGLVFVWQEESRWCHSDRRGRGRKNLVCRT